MTTEDLNALVDWLKGRPELTTLAPVVSGTEFPKLLITAGPAPATPDRVIAVMSYQGPQPPNNWQMDGRASIFVRGVGGGKTRHPYQDAGIIADAIERLIAPPGDQRQVIDLPGGRRAALKLVTDRAPLGFDSSNGRYQFTINVGLESIRA
jgi:hypothetical protein